MEKQKYEQEEINKSNEEIWNKQKFDKAFEKELTNWEISDHKTFWEMISWENFNENNNWQKNLENAYLSKIWAEIDKLDNLSDEEKQNLKIEQESFAKDKNPNELLEAYNSIKNNDSKINQWELAKNQKELAGGEKQNDNKEKSALDKLKDSINKNNEIQQIKQNTQKELNELMKQIEWEEKNKELAAVNSLEFPISEK